MKCVVVTPDNAWDYDNVKDARKKFNKMVKYYAELIKKGEESEAYITLWSATKYYGGWGLPIEEVRLTRDRVTGKSKK